MGSLQELEHLLKRKDDKIRELQRQLDEKEMKIQELRSQLDKFQSVLPATVRPLLNGPRKQRAQGISAEPQNFRTIQDLSQKTFRKHSKNNR
ncbi:hypothetical protein LOTGIDRAFT_107417 [Lottia gigantea]|uniref:cGMP-dependent protein kinase N-terminal coiled-coil domain-containing protein n=1 Tax=Lottia gigantea TaxID=225164 RepID=V4BEC5_LOTGI|nr:hypothetical protein LOTGIDRAFT_107417 [Lottia gigantea]ESO87204.1 hypothetical protein LOTGIDRAFT_107417 [Lottia gigantea]